MRLPASLQTCARIASSTRLTVACFLLLAVLTFWGTLYQAGHGLYAAQQDFFYSWITMLGGIVPFPGVKLVLATLILNLCAAAVDRFRYGWGSAGLILIHLGLAVLLVGGGFTHYTARQSYLTLREGEESDMAATFRDTVAMGRVKLPVTVRLLDFVKKDHPGTAMAAGFESHVRVTGPGIDRNAVISMNRPLRYRSLAFYQSSYSQDGGGESTTLAVVENRAKALPYAATLLMGLGLVIHFLVKLTREVRRLRLRPVSAGKGTA